MTLLTRTGQRRAIVPSVLIAAAIAAVVVLVVVLASGGANHRELVIESPTATWMGPGLQVRVAGQVVGHVVSAQPTRAGSARVVISIDDAGVWPLPRGTQAEFRWPGTIAFTNRYVELTLPAHASGTLPAHASGTLPDGGVISGQDVQQGTEFDQVFDVFNGATRSSMKTLLDEGGPALSDAKQGLAGTLRNAPSALNQARLALQELGSDPEQLSTLVTSTDAVVHEVQTANPGIGALVDGAATTLGATAARASALGQSLQELPATLTDVRTTLARAQTTLTSADQVLKSVSPGVQRVITLAPNLDRLLRTVVQVGPSADQTLTSLRTAVPALNPLLAKAQSLMPEFEQIGRLGTTELNCIRPYAPEAAGLASTWDGFIQYSDGHDKYARVSGGVYPYPLSEMPLTDSDVVKLFPALHYVFPAPPGEVAGQPWFNSACGVGPDSLNAAANPEAK